VVIHADESEKTKARPPDGSFHSNRKEKAGPAQAVAGQDQAQACRAQENAPARAPRGAFEADLAEGQGHDGQDNRIRQGLFYPARRRTVDPEAQKEARYVRGDGKFLVVPATAGVAILRTHDPNVGRRRRD